MLKVISGDHLFRCLAPSRTNLVQVAQSLFQSSFEYLKAVGPLAIVAFSHFVVLCNLTLDRKSFLAMDDSAEENKFVSYGGLRFLHAALC